MDLSQKKQSFLEEQAILRGKIKAQEFQPKDSFEVDWQRIKTKFFKAFEKLKSLTKRMRSEDSDPVGLSKLAYEVEESFSKFSDELDRDQSDAKSRREDEEKLEKIKLRVKALDEEIKIKEASLNKLTEKEEETKKQLFVKERLLRNKQDTLLRTRDEKNYLSIEQARLMTRKETLSDEAKDTIGPNFKDLILKFRGSVPAGTHEKIQKLKAELSEIGGVDDLTLQEYKETEERYSYLTEQLKDLEKGIKDLKTVIEELDGVIKEEFSKSFKKIYHNFQNYFRVLFGGGRATMSIIREKQEQVDEAGELDGLSRRGGAEVEEDTSSDLSSEALVNGETRRAKDEIVGIQINATPPGKKLAGIAALSGGERALTAIALLSALLASYPTPFVVLDEVDAALDEANSIRFGKIIGQLSDKTQFITITHNRETMRQSHTLYGVTMDEKGVSQILSLKLDQASAYST